MTITFYSTSNSNLVIREPPQNNSVTNIDELVRDQWIPYQAFSQRSQLLPEILCVDGSTIIIDNNSDLNNNTDVYDTFPTHTGLVGTILTAYNLHQNLQLRPDDVWITILSQFALYVNGRPEELRSAFVNHVGQIDLKVVADFGTVCNAPYAAMTLQFLDEIALHLVDPTLREWFLPGFSTTTETDNIAASATAMCTLQAYFTYTYFLLCGIPQVTLLGSVQDWALLRNKVERLITFDGKDKLLSEQWVPLLRQVLDEFVQSATYGSTNNMSFWDSIVQFHEKDAGCFEEMRMNGWLSVFTFFDGQGQKGASIEDGSPWPSIRLDAINHNVVTCPVNVNDNGVLYNASLYVGQLAFDFVPESTTFADFPPSLQVTANQAAILHTIRPRNDWALAIHIGETDRGGWWWEEAPPRSDAVVEFTDVSLQCPKVQSGLEATGVEPATRASTPLPSLQPTPSVTGISNVQGGVAQTSLEPAVTFEPERVSTPPDLAPTPSAFPIGQKVGSTPTTDITLAPVRTSTSPFLQPTLGAVTNGGVGFEPTTDKPVVGGTPLPSLPPSSDPLSIAIDLQPSLISATSNAAYLSTSTFWPMLLLVTYTAASIVSGLFLGRRQNGIKNDD